MIKDAKIMADKALFEGLIIDEYDQPVSVKMVGGESFLYPRFVELARCLVEKHYILLSINLSTKNVYEFADVIPPERVLTICAASHITEREKRKNGELMSIGV